MEVTVSDINDNPPKFLKKVFTGGITTNSEFGHEILFLEANDPDFGRNAKLRYYLSPHSMTKTLSEGLENLPLYPFLVDKNSGSIKLNFIPQTGMKGYFDFEVSSHLSFSINLI